MKFQFCCSLKWNRREDLKNITTKIDSHSVTEKGKLPQPSTNSTLLIINSAETQQDLSFKLRINFKKSQLAAVLRCVTRTECW